MADRSSGSVIIGHCSPDPTCYKSFATRSNTRSASAVLSLLVGVFSAMLVNTNFCGHSVVLAILAVAVGRARGSSRNHLAVDVHCLWRHLQPDSPWTLVLPAHVAGISDVGHLLRHCRDFVACDPDSYVGDTVPRSAQFQPRWKKHPVNLTERRLPQYLPVCYLAPYLADYQTDRVLLTIWSLTRWDIITVLTAGGPVGTTTTIVVGAQQQAFTYQQVGMGAAYAMIGLVLASILAVGYFLLEQREQRRAAR